MPSIRWARGLRSVGWYRSSSLGWTAPPYMTIAWAKILDALLAANLNRVFGAVALRALEVYAISTPWLHQDTTTLTLYGAYEEATRPDGQAPQAPAGPVPPRPAYGHSKDGHDDLRNRCCSKIWSQQLMVVLPTAP